MRDNSRLVHRGRRVGPVDQTDPARRACPADLADLVRLAHPVVPDCSTAYHLDQADLWVLLDRVDQAGL